MEESEIQKQVSEAIIERKGDDLTLSLTDNERCIVANLGDMNSLYTAEEARNLADVIHQASARKDGDWDETPIEMILYFYDFADVVDGIMDAEAVEEKWNGETDFDQSDLEEKFREVATRPHHL